MRERLSFANVMSVIAVFIALGGTAVAVNLGRNSVGPKELRKGAVRSPDIKNNRVKGVDVNEATLDASSFTRAAHAVDPGGLCGQGAAFEECASVSLQLPRSARVAAYADAGFQALDDNSYGTCRILVAGTEIATATGGEVTDTTGNPQLNAIGLNGLSAPVGPGPVSVAMQCRENSSQIEFYDSSLTALMVGPG